MDDDEISARPHAHVMTKEAAEKYREQYRKATEKCGDKRFQHFATAAQMERHLQEVAEAQKAGSPF